MSAGVRTVVRIRDVKGCARCGGDHAEVRGYKFKRPPVVDGKTFESWATCPDTLDPVFILSTPANAG